MFRKIMFRFFWNTYDFLGGWLLMSALAFCVSLPVVTLPAAWGALLACAARADDQSAFGWSDFWRAFVRYGVRSTVMGLLLAVGSVLLAVNVWFYTAYPGLQSIPLLARLAFSCLIGWLGVFIFIGLMNGWAFMVLQDLPLIKAIKRGLMVTVAHPVASLFTLVFAVSIFVLMGVSVLGMVALAGGLLANLWMGVVCSAIEFYEELEDKQLRAKLEKEGFRSWKELKDLEEREAVRYRRRDRSWKDILRPWEMR